MLRGLEVTHINAPHVLFKSCSKGHIRNYADYRTYIRRCSTCTQQLATSPSLFYKINIGTVIQKALPQVFS